MALTVLAFLILAGVWLLTRDQADIEWLTKRPAGKRPSLAFLGQYGRPIKTQLQRFRRRLFGTPHAVVIRTRIVELSSPHALSNLVSSAPAFSNAHGAQVWIIQDIQPWQKVTNPAILVRGAATMAVSDGMQAQMLVGESVPIAGRLENVGFQLDLWPSSRGASLDLVSFLIATEKATNRLGDDPGDATNVVLIRTNAAFGARVRLPPGSSAFLLSGRGTNQHGKTIGALFSPSLIRR